MRYLKILKIILVNAYIRDSKVPGVVTANILSSFLEIIITITMLSAIFSNISALAGWNYYQMLFLYILMKFIYQANGLISHSGLTRMAKEYVRLGDYDFYLTKPVNTLIMVSISKPRVYNVLMLLFSIVLGSWVAIKAGININFLNLLTFTVALIPAILLFYFINVITITPAFWFVRLYSLSELMNRATQFMRYPAGIYPFWARVIFYTLAPILAVAYLPAWLLFNPPKLEYIIYMVLLTAAVGFIALRFWKIGERHYGSASS